MEKNYHTCSCGHRHIVDKREITLYLGMVKALWSVYRWSQEKGRYEFKMSDIKSLLEKNSYARFGDWVYFGGLIYKNGKSLYGINKERCEGFFYRQAKIPARVLKDPITKQIEIMEYKCIGEIPELTEFLDADKMYQANYQEVDGRPTEQKPLL